MAEGKKYHISVNVNTAYLADQSDPASDRYVFAYTITIANTGNLTTAGTITLPNSNTLTGVSGYTQFSGGISVNGATTYYINSSGNANFNTATVNSTLNVTGTTTLAGALVAQSTASVSGALTLYGTPTIATTAKQSLTLGDADTGNIILAPSGGNVGIGTTAPASKLHVNGIDGIRLSSWGGWGQTYSTASQVFGSNIYVNPSDTVSRQVRSINTHASYGHAYIEFYGGDTVFNNSTATSTANAIVTPVEAMRIDGSNGNVGIGTTAPGWKLEVNGYFFFKQKTAYEITV